MDQAITTRARRAGARALAGLVPSLSRPAWTVLAGDTLSAVGSGLTLPFLFVYLSRVRGLTPAIAGLGVSTVAVVAFAGNPLSGWLADRVGPRPTLIAGLLVAAAGGVALAGVHGASMAIAATGLAGLGVSIVWPAQDALLAMLVGPAQRSEVFSVRHCTLNAGFAIGALIGASFVDVSRPWTFSAIYVADAASFLLFVPVLFTVRVPARPPRTASAQRPGYRVVLRDRAFRRLWIWTAVLITVGYGQYHSGFPGFAARPAGVPARALALVFVANTVTVVACQLVVLRAVGGWRRTRALGCTATCWAAAWALALLGGALGSGPLAVAAFAASMIVFGLGETTLSPSLAPLVNDLAPDELRGRYNGASTLAWTTGFTVGPAVAGLALASRAGEALFAGLVAACLLLAVGAVRLERHLPPAANRIGAARPAHERHVEPAE